MRRDTRLGLGIGALLLAFIVTFLVVRNYAGRQTELANTDGGQDQSEGIAPQAGQAETNPAAPATAGDATAPNAAAALAQQSPAGTGVGQAVAPAKDDAFARGKQGPPTNLSHDWDRLLATGKVDPNTGGPVTRTPAPQPANAAAAPPATASSAGPRNAFQPAGEAGVSPKPMSAPAGPAAAATHVPPVAGGNPAIGATSRSHTVREGETFVSIAQAAYGNGKYFLQIKAANPTVNPSRLRVGQQIVLPELSAEARSARASRAFHADQDNRLIDPSAEYRVDAGDSLYRIAVKQYGTPRMVDAIYEANRDAIGPDPERLRLGMVLKLPTTQRAGK